MNPELITVVKERIELEHTDDAISTELKEAGYDEATIKEVLASARQGNAMSKEIPPATTSFKLSPASSLFKNGFVYLTKRLDLALILAIPYVVMSLYNYLIIVYPAIQETAKIFVGLLGLIVVVIYMLLLVAVLYIVTFSSEREVSFRESLGWAKDNLLAFIWLNILMSLVVMGGFMLFIVPGIILSIYLYLSQYVFIKEGLKGMDALVRSRDLIVGKWLNLASRILVIGLIFIISLIALGFVLGFTFAFLPESPALDFILDLIIQVFSAGITLIGIHVGIEMYRQLTSPEAIATASNKPSGKKKFIAWATLGLFFPVAMFLFFTWALQQETTDIYQSPPTEESDTSAKDRALELRLETELEEE